MQEVPLRSVSGSREKKATVSARPALTTDPAGNPFISPVEFESSIKNPDLTGRALDAAVAGTVLGWRSYDHRTSDRERRTQAPPGWVAGALRQDYDLVPPFSTDLAAAWSVAEGLAARGWQMRLTNGPGRKAPWHCAFLGPGISPMRASPGGGKTTGTDAGLGSSGQTAPEAICRAALEVAAFLSWPEEAEPGRQGELNDVGGASS